MLCNSFVCYTQHSYYLFQCCYQQENFSYIFCNSYNYQYNDT